MPVYVRHVLVRLPTSNSASWHRFVHSPHVPWRVNLLGLSPRMRTTLSESRTMFGRRSRASMLCKEMNVKESVKKNCKQALDRKSSGCSLRLRGVGPRTKTLAHSKGLLASFAISAQGNSSKHKLRPIASFPYKFTSWLPFEERHRPSLSSSVM